MRPRYDGYGSANLPNSVLRHFGVPGGLPPLAEAVLPPAWFDGVRAIVVLLIDALGYDQLCAALDRGACPNLAALIARPETHFVPITSVFPSTTAAALSTLATGEPPIRHGMVGFTLWLERPRTVVDMIQFAPASREPGVDGLPDPRTFLPVQTVFMRLAAAGVDPVFVNQRRYLRSALSVMHSAGARTAEYASFADLCALLPELAHRADGRPRYVQAYWDAVDTVAHLRGPGAPGHEAELAAVDFCLGRDVLRADWPRDTLLLITADHGQTATNPERAVWLDAAPDLLAQLRHPPSGERRAVYLDPLDGRRDAVTMWCATVGGEAATILGRDAALSLELWGPGRVWNEAVRRLGELIALATPGWQLPFRHAEADRQRPPAIGAHGSLTRAEVLVPLIAARLGSRH